MIIRKWLYVAALVSAAGVVMDQRGCTIPVGPVTTAAPFKVPDGCPVAMIYVAPADPAGIQKLTSAQADVLTQSQAYVESVKGKFRTVQTAPGEFEEPWVRDAYAKKGDSIPWAVAAGPTRGFSRAVPADVKIDQHMTELKALK